MSPVVSLLLFALAVPMSAALLALAAPAVEAHAVALEGKYLVGRIAALVALVILLPLLIFRQRRVGEGGEVFEMLKFRSMRAGDASGFVPIAGVAPGGVEGTDRRTAVGRFIRRTSLDELPQLWNVVRGDMCLVGPRPERPEHVARFAADVPGYASRHRVRVGLTGLAQVSGSRGASDIGRRAEMDNAYIDGWSLGLDLRILGRTAGAVLRGAE
jgi:lipopolysaccharide/colanic/teichoic acid biosynthesis glycosyltransferase